jgi:16S rRNA (adenine1518-N6/adenine1519-N6)-dimethyltransferase
MAQTRQQIIELLESISREPNRKLGQHFMIDEKLVDRLVAEAALGDHPVIVEIGPGTGTLTGALLAAGADVVAVEIDPVLADLVESELGEQFPGRLTVIRGDVLEGKHHLNSQLIAKLAELCGAERQEKQSAKRQAEERTSESFAKDEGRPPNRVARLVANLPYNIASPLVAELIDLTWHGRIVFDRLVFTVQREVADRLTAQPDTKEYGPLSVLCQCAGRVDWLVHKISPNAFYPKPNVFSSMLAVNLPADRVAAVTDLESLHQWLDAGFGHRRKTLAASIRFAPTDWQIRLTTAAVAAGIDLTRRGETLTVDEYLALTSET